MRKDLTTVHLLAILTVFPPANLSRSPKRPRHEHQPFAALSLVLTTCSFYVMVTRSCQPSTKMVNFPQTLSYR